MNIVFQEGRLLYGDYHRWQHYLLLTDGAIPAIKINKFHSIKIFVSCSVLIKRVGRYVNSSGGLLFCS